MMSAEIPAGSVTRWIQQLDDGPVSEAQQQLWARYFERLTTVARQHLTPATRRVVDEEDVALSVLDSFFAAAGHGRYPDVRDRTGLWPLLARMAVCKAFNRRRAEEALKQCEKSGAFAYALPHGGTWFAQKASQSFKVMPDGQIELTTRKGDAEVVNIYSDEADLQQRNPQAYERYRDVLDAEVE